MVLNASNIFLLVFGSLLWGHLHALLAQNTNEAIVRDIEEAYQNLDFTSAEAQIVAALENYDRFSPFELGKIYLVSALIRFSDNDIEEARKQLALAYQVAPSLTLDPRNIPPGMIALYNDLEAQQHLAKTALSTEIRYLIVRDPRPAAAMRSMLLPGWGQFYKKDRKKGFIFAGLWSAASAGAVVAQINRKRAEDRYLASENLAQIESRYPRFDAWHKIRNNLLLGAAGVWLFSYLDAMIDKDSPLMSDGTDSPVSFDFRSAKNTTSLSFTLRF